MKTFEFQIPTRVIFGAGSLNQLGEAATKIGTKTLVISDVVMRKMGYLDRVCDQLRGVGIDVVVDDHVMPNPVANYVDDMVRLFLDEKCDAVVGLGGGSAMDTAKAVGLVARNGGKMVDYMPGGRRETLENVVPAFPIIAITTTAGTGAEVTKFAVITNLETREKPGVGHESLYPKLAIVDPELTLTLSKRITETTGVDVLFHGMEAYLSKPATPFTDLLAIEAMEIVMKHLETVIVDPQNLHARTRISYANTLAGVAIVQATTIAIHGLGHAVGGATNAAHGLTMAAIGPAFLDFSFDANIKKYAKVTQLLKYEVDGLSEEEQAARAGDALRHVLKKFDSLVSLMDLGVTEELLPELVDSAYRTMQGCIDASLKEVSREDAMQIYRASL
ncbi:iron-containing alcohol dehydrogenase [Gottschalkiaceae bacterium SANA]|nr:iron-containing alcohol dehydrogenase [Gottschalkiaceae bacterium SANA]